MFIFIINIGIVISVIVLGKKINLIIFYSCIKTVFNCKWIMYFNFIICLREKKIVLFFVFKWFIMFKVLVIFKRCVYFKKFFSGCICMLFNWSEYGLFKFWKLFLKFK